jgi:anti-sigma factor RsiW
MTDRHLDEGIIQAYIDGELPREDAAATAAHLGSCAACSVLLAEAEGQSSFFATAFAPDDSLSVPTAALRARLNAAVAQLEAPAKPEQRHSQGWSLGGFFASLSGLLTLTPRAVAAFATLLVAVAVGIIYFASQKSSQPPAGSQTGTEMARGVQAPAPTPQAVQPPDVPVPVASPERGQVDQVYQVVSHRPRAPKRRVEPRAPKAEALPGEQEYRTAIASLEKTIKLGGDESLRPALRADYERNLALIDSAITQTRQVAAQNPKDKDAVGFLMSAYQSKIELLTRVADQAQVSALGR